MSEKIKLIVIGLWAICGFICLNTYIVKDIYNTLKIERNLEKLKAFFGDRSRVNIHLKRGLTEEEIQKNDLAVFKFISFGNNRELYKLEAVLNNTQFKDEDHVEEICQVLLEVYNKENDGIVFYETIYKKDLWKVLDYFVEI